MAQEEGGTDVSAREYTVEVAINRQGLRDVVRPYPARASTFRALALGDSFVEAYSVPLAESVTQVLQASLDRPGCRADVINARTAAYSTDQEYLFYRSEGVRYSPNVVVLFFYFNDVLFNSLPTTSGPEAALGAGRVLVVENEPVPAPRPARPRAHPTADAPPRSVLFEWVRQRLRRGAPRAYAALGRAGLWPVPRVEVPHDQLKVFRTRQIADIDAAWEVTTSILDALAREVAGRRRFRAYLCHGREPRRDGISALPTGPGQWVWAGGEPADRVGGAPGPGATHRPLRRRRDLGGQYKWIRHGNDLGSPGVAAGERSLAPQLRLAPPNHARGTPGSDMWEPFAKLRAAAVTSRWSASRSCPAPPSSRRRPG